MLAATVHVAGATVATAGQTDDLKEEEMRAQTCAAKAVRNETSETMKAVQKVAQLALTVQPKAGAIVAVRIVLCEISELQQYNQPLQSAM